MFLQYGISSDKQLVYVSEVPKGKTALHCPWCDGLLVAKKGDIKIHHFAHAGETCRQAQRDFETLSLPVFDKFDLRLTADEMDGLRRIYNNGAASYWQQEHLERRGLAKNNKYARNGRGQWELTNVGKIPFGELSLALFNEYQEQKIAERHDEHLKAAQLAYHNQRADLEFLLADLRIYRAQWRRILSTTLYFLKINTPTQPDLYKVGVTIRHIDERVTEVKAQLLPFIGDTQIEVLGTWANRGNVEFYFKYRYREQQHPIGVLTEYFVFPDIKSVLSYDLRRMKPKEFSDLEWEVLAGEPSRIEREIEADQVEAELEAKRAQRRAAISQGMQAKKLQGKHVGRPPKSDEEFFADPKIKAVIQALNSGMSVRKTAQTVGVSTSTISEVKQRLRQKGEPFAIQGKEEPK